jgi:hypothetical protein
VQNLPQGQLVVEAFAAIAPQLKEEDVRVEADLILEAISRSHKDDR